MLAEPLDVFFNVAEFAVSATLNGVAVSAIVDTSTVAEDPFGGGAVLTQSPSALLKSSDAAAAAAGQGFVAGGITYTVRQVVAEPPDGVLTRLVLARA